MGPFGQGVYVNNLGEDGDAAVRDAYGENCDRLAALEEPYDPDNVLRSSQNVPPRETAREGES